MADKLVEERPNEATDDRADDVDRDQLIEVPLGADQAAEQLRADLAGRVERSAGDRADEDDDPVDDEADDDPGKAGRRATVDRGPEHGEDQDGRANDLGGDPDEHARIGIDRDGPEAELRRIVAG